MYMCSLCCDACFVYKTYASQIIVTPNFICLYLACILVHISVNVTLENLLYFLPKKNVVIVQVRFNQVGVWMAFISSLVFFPFNFRLLLNNIEHTSCNKNCWYLAGYLVLFIAFVGISCWIHCVFIVFFL